MKSKNKKQKGYTLLEILVVVVIIGTLSYFSVPIYNKVINRADVSDALHNIDMLSGAEAKYFIENGRYTEDLSSLETPLKGEEAKIGTTRFTYLAGNPREDDFCIYSQSNAKKYTLARNYKTNSDVFCSGDDCGKIESFVKEGDFKELCGSTGPSLTCDKSDEYCRRLNENWSLLKDCSCGCASERVCSKSHKWSQEKCDCVPWNSSCDLTEEKCQSLYTVNHILYTDGSGDCECKCKYNEEICKESNADGFDEKRCSCICMNDDVKKCSEQGKILTSDCECVCAEVKKCEKGFIFSQETCECEKTDCDITEEMCKEKNENWTLLGNCSCGCNKKAMASKCLPGYVYSEEKCACVVEKCDLTDEYCQENFGEDYLLNREKCLCERNTCDKDEEYCKKNYTEVYVFDNKTCSCVCGLTEEKCKNQGAFLNTEKCACVKDDCDKTDEICKKQNENWSLLEDCTCGCPKAKICLKGETWNSEKCQCEPLIGCDKIEEECKKMNENYILDKELCNCKCGLVEKDCTSQGLNFNSAKCKCEGDSCDKTEEYCNKVNANWTLLADCTCGCKSVESCGKGQVWDSEKCACVKSESCDKTEEECKKMNENYILDKSLCNCKCGLVEKDCTSQGLSFNSAKCKCEGEICDKTEEYCRKINDNWTLLSDCTCGCSKVISCSKGEVWNSEKCVCEKNGCNDITDEYCKKINPNYYLEGTKCRCLCSLNKYSCGLEGLWFDESNCACKEI